MLFLKMHKNIIKKDETVEFDEKSIVDKFRDLNLKTEEIQNLKETQETQYNDLVSKIKKYKMIESKLNSAKFETNFDFQNGFK